MDILALAISSEPDRRTSTEACVQSGRLLLVKNYIDERLGDPDLSLADIARKNGISLRTLHQLFQPMGMSASEWLRTRRLQRCYDMLTSARHEEKSITEIAYSAGINSSSHFSDLFREQFGLRPLTSERPRLRQVSHERRAPRALAAVSALLLPVTGPTTARRARSISARPQRRGGMNASRRRRTTFPPTVAAWTPAISCGLGARLCLPRGDFCAGEQKPCAAAQAVT